MNIERERERDKAETFIAPVLRVASFCEKHLARARLRAARDCKKRKRA